MRRLGILILLGLAVGSIDRTASASLRRVEVKKGSREARELGLTVTVTRDRHFPDAPIVTVTAREDGPLQSLFASGLRVAEGERYDLKTLSLDVPIQPRRPFRQKPGLDFTFRIHDSMIRSATLYFRTGTPYSEVLYEVPLRQYAGATAK